MFTAKACGCSADHERILHTERKTTDCQLSRGEETHVTRDLHDKIEVKLFYSRSYAGKTQKLTNFFHLIVSKCAKKKNNNTIERSISG